MGLLGGACAQSRQPFLPMACPMYAVTHHLPLCASTSYGLIHRLIDEGIEQRLQSRRIGGLILSVQMIPVGPLAPRLATIRSMRAEGCGRGRGAVVGASVLGGGISASRFQRRCGTHTVTLFRMHVLLYCSPGPWISL